MSNWKVKEVGRLDLIELDNKIWSLILVSAIILSGVLFYFFLPRRITDISDLPTTNFSLMIDEDAKINRYGEGLFIFDEYSNSNDDLEFVSGDTDIWFCTGFDLITNLYNATIELDISYFGLYSTKIEIYNATIGTAYTTDEGIQVEIPNSIIPDSVIASDEGNYVDEIELGANSLLLDETANNTFFIAINVTSIGTSLDIGVVVNNSNPLSYFNAEGDYLITEALVDVGILGAPELAFDLYGFTNETFHYGEFDFELALFKSVLNSNTKNQTEHLFDYQTIGVTDFDMVNGSTEDAPIIEKGVLYDFELPIGEDMEFGQYIEYIILLDDSEMGGIFVSTMITAFIMMLDGMEGMIPFVIGFETNGSVSLEACKDYDIVIKGFESYIEFSYLDFIEYETPILEVSLFLEINNVDYTFISETIDMEYLYL